MNRFGKALAVFGVCVVALFALAMACDARPPQAPPTRAEFDGLAGQVDDHESRLSALEKKGCPCGPGCECPPGVCPDCPSVGGGGKTYKYIVGKLHLLTDGEWKPAEKIVLDGEGTTVILPPLKEGGNPSFDGPATMPATGGHWNCGPGGCRFVPDRPATVAPIRAMPKPAGDGWQWSESGGFWFRPVPVSVRTTPAPAPVRVVTAPAPRPTNYVSTRTRSVSPGPFVGVSARAGTTPATPVRIAAGRTIRPTYSAAPAPYRAHTATRAVVARVGGTTSGCANGFG